MNMQFFRNDSRWKLVVGWTIILGLLGWSVFRMVRRLSDTPYEDFQAFYLAGQAAANGSDPYRAGTEMYIYLPMLAAWMAPLSKLTLTQAAWVWFALTLTATLGSLWLAWRVFSNRLGWKATGADGVLAVGIALLIWQTQCRWQFEQGQTDWLTLLTLTLSLAALDRFPIVVGMALGFAINIKYVPIVLVGYLAMRRRWSCVLWSIVGTIVWGLAPALVYGWQNNLIYLREALSGLAKLVGVEIPGQAGYVFPLTYDRSITIPSAWARIAEAYGAGMATVAGLTALSAGIVCAFGCLVYRIHGARLFQQRGGCQEHKPAEQGWVALEFCFVMLLMIVFSPQSQMRHFYLLLPLVLAASGLLVCGSSVRIRFLALVGLLIGLFGSIGADFFTIFGMRDTWKYISGMSCCTLVLGFTTLAAGMQEIAMRLGKLTIASAPTEIEPILNRAA